MCKLFLVSTICKQSALSIDHESRVILKRALNELSSMKSGQDAKKIFKMFCW